MNLCQNSSGTITLKDSIYNYESILIENNNFGYVNASVPNNSNLLRVGTISISGSIMVLCCGAWNITNNGKTLTPAYMAQANIESGGVTYFTLNANLTWNIVGLKH